MKTVRSNKLQRFFHNSHQDTVRSSSRSERLHPCVILEVMGDEDESPDSLLKARVFTDSGEYILPFAEDQAAVISLRGNSEVLKNKRAYISFSDGNFATGSILFKNGSSLSIAPVSKSTEGYSIGGLLSG